MTLSRRQALAAFGALSATALLPGCAGFRRGAATRRGGRRHPHLHHVGHRRRAGRLPRRHRRFQEANPGRRCSSTPSRTSRCSPTSTRRSRRATRRTSSGCRTTPSAATPAPAAARPHPAPAGRLRRPLHPARLGRGAERRQAVRRPAPHRHLGDPLQQGRCSTPPASPRCRRRRGGLDLGPVRGGRGQLRELAARREVPVRLQLAGQRRHALAEPAVPGRRPLPRRGPHDPGHRLRRRPGRDRLQPRLLHRQAGAGQRLGEVHDLRRRHSGTPRPRPWSSAARSWSPTPTRPLDFTWGATFAPRERPRRAATSAATRSSPRPAPRTRSWRRSSWTFVTEAEQMRAFCATAPRCCRPARDLVEQGIEFAVRPELVPGLPRPGRAGAGAGLGPGGLAGR